MSSAAGCLLAGSRSTECGPCKPRLLRKIYVRFIGHPDGCNLPLPDGRALRVAYNQVIEVPDEIGWSLLKQEPTWQFANGPELTDNESEAGDDQSHQIERITPGELLRRSLKATRARRGWTQQQLADEVTEAGYPVTQDRISQIENGRSKLGVSVDELVAIAHTLNLSPTRLLEGATLPDTLEVAITSTATTSLWGYHAWLHSLHALTTDQAGYRLQVNDHDHLNRLHLTLQLLTQAVEELIDSSERNTRQPSAEHRQALAEATTTVKLRLRELEQSRTLPSQRPQRRERRGRPRTRKAKR